MTSAVAGHGVRHAGGRHVDDDLVYARSTALDKTTDRSGRGDLECIGGHTCAGEVLESRELDALHRAAAQASD